MARVSFTFRKEPVADNLQGGSTLQHVLSGDDDSALRGDTYVSSPTAVLTEEETSFSAQVIDYGRVLLKWSIGTPLSTPVDATPVATSITVRWDTIGEPQTVANGQQVTTITADRVNESMEHFVGLDGVWVYYSIFVKYEGVGVRSWYEKVGDVHVLTPNRYGSTDNLYSRISRHWRLQDNDLGIGVLNSSSELFGYGQLYRALDIFGWDIDRLRTHIHHQTVTKDPQLATSEALDALAYELGVDLRVVDLGTERLRNIITDIGYLRQSKGTVSGVREWLTAISGSDVEIRTTPTNYLTSTQASCGGTITNTTNGALLPTGNTWVVESTTATAVANGGGGMDITRTGGTDYEVVVAKTKVLDLNQGSTYTAYYDAYGSTNASVFAVYLSPDIADGTAAYTNASTGFGYLTGKTGESRTNGEDWFQIPTYLGMPGNGTFTTTPMYLHVYMMLGPSASITLNNFKVYNNDAFPYEIDILSQRANLLRDPQFNYTNDTQWISTGASTTARGTRSYIVNTAASGGAVTIAPQQDSPYRVGVPYYFSVDDVYNNIDSVEILSTEYGLIATGELQRESLYSDGSVRKVWKLYREYGEPWVARDLLDTNLVIYATSGTAKKVEIRRPLLEYINASGDYFDGDNPNGGWLASTTLGVGVADYRWGAAGKNDSFSYYTSDYQRTIFALKRELAKILPATQTDDPTDILNFNRIYGYTGVTLL